MKLHRLRLLHLCDLKLISKPIWCQAIIKTNSEFFSAGSKGLSISEIEIEMLAFLYDQTTLGSLFLT